MVENEEKEKNENIILLERLQYSYSDRKCFF